MLLVEGLAFFVLMVLCLAPETVLGRWLHVRLVEKPARRLGAIKRAVWIFAGLVVVAMALLAWLTRGEGAMVASIGLPDLLAWFTTFEVSTWADALVAVALAASLTRLRMIGPWLRGSMSKAQRRLRPPRGKKDEGSQEPLA